MFRSRITATAVVVGVAALAGGGVAVAASSGDDVWVAGYSAASARAAAVAYLGSGSGGSVELDGEHGATYDVEVRRAGSVVDVWLDASFHPLASELDEGK